MAHGGLAAGVRPSSFSLPSWKLIVGAVAAWLVAIPFIVAGVWKITEPFAAAERMTQALVPYQLSGFAAFAFGVSETLAAAMLVVPRFRRWGGILTSALLVAFLLYIGIFYSRLTGADCNCFPWIKRAVGPMFFVSDGVMLVLAALAAWWATPSRGLRPAAILLGVIAVFAGVMYGVQVAQQTGLEAPPTITVAGQTRPLRQGKVFLFFYDPECSECFYAASDLAKETWTTEGKVYGIPTSQKKWANDFLHDTKFKAEVSMDDVALRKVFQFTDPPYAVILEYGRQKFATTNFANKEIQQKLREYGFIK